MHQHLQQYPQLQSQTGTLSESRILFEQVVVDNQPTQEQIIQRAQQLQIDDLSLARQSLTKQLQPNWRPYINRYGDVYYIDLNQQLAYIDHPVDMETKILYAKRYKRKTPKFKSYSLSDVVGTIKLIQEETIKWKRGTLIQTSHSIPSQLNIVYEQSDQSQQTQRQQQDYHSQQNFQQQFVNQSQHFVNQSQNEDDEYIENLQYTGRLMKKQNIKPQDNKNNLIPGVFNKNNLTPGVFSIGHKRFPTVQDESEEDNHNKKQQQEQELSPQYEKLLMEYEQQLRSQHYNELKEYRLRKQLNCIKRQQMLKQTIKRKQQQYKHQLLRQYQHQIEEKNQSKYQQDLFNVKSQYINKIYNYQQKLYNQIQIINKLEQNHQQKVLFIQQLQHSIQSKSLSQKYVQSQALKHTLYHNYYLPSINNISQQSQQSFTKQSFKVIHSKINQKIKQNGVYDSITNQVINYNSLSSMYQSLLKTQLIHIDQLLVQNQVNRQMRKRRHSLFNQKLPLHQKQLQSISYITHQPNYLIEQKQNDKNIMNINLTIEQKGSIAQMIQKDIIKSTQNQLVFRQRRNKIFNTNNQSIIANQPKIKQMQQNIKQLLKQSRISVKQNQQKQISRQMKQKLNYHHNFNLIKPDRKSMYLRMMKRIL